MLSWGPDESPGNVGSASASKARASRLSWGPDESPGNVTDYPEWTSAHKVLSWGPDESPGNVQDALDAAHGLANAFMGPGRIARECFACPIRRDRGQHAFMGPGRIARECIAVVNERPKGFYAFMGPGRIARECLKPGLLTRIAAELSWGPDESPGNVWRILRSGPL